MDFVVKICSIGGGRKATSETLSTDQKKDTILATPERARSNDRLKSFRTGCGAMASALPWLTKMSINFINIAHKQINSCTTKCKLRFVFYRRSLPFSGLRN